MDWLVLYSAQQWNFYMNSLYEAIESAINIVRGEWHFLPKLPCRHLKPTLWNV